MLLLPSGNPFDITAALSDTVYCLSIQMLNSQTPPTPHNFPFLHWCSLHHGNSTESLVGRVQLSSADEFRFKSQSSASTRNLLESGGQACDLWPYWIEAELLPEGASSVHGILELGNSIGNVVTNTLIQRATESYQLHIPISASCLHT